MWPASYFPSDYWVDDFFPKTGASQKVVKNLMVINYSMPTAYSAWARAEAITLRKLDATPGGNAVTDTAVSDAHKSVPSRAEKVPSGGSYQELEVVWRLPAALLGGVEPFPADQIIDGDSVVWTITEVSYANLTQEYRCDALNLSLYLADQITIERPIFTRNAFKLAVPAWGAIYSAVSARVQPADETPEVEASSQLFVRTFDVFVAQQLDLQSNDRVLYGTDYYEILGHSNARRIGDLTQLRIRSTT